MVLELTLNFMFPQLYAIFGLVFYLEHFFPLNSMKVISFFGGGKKWNLNKKLIKNSNNGVL